MGGFAKNYLEVFDAISEQRDFSLVLTDLAMPGAKWLDAIRKIHEILPDTPIIILSAVFDKEIVQKAIELGAAGYIPKRLRMPSSSVPLTLFLSGGVYIPPELLQQTEENDFDMLKNVETLSPAQTAKEKARNLSPR